MDIEQDIKALAEAVALHGDGLQRNHGERLVLLCAVLALVRTHPDSRLFAQAFRRVWIQLGEFHAESELGTPIHDGIGQMLSLLEASCSVPLGVRAPNVAMPPGE